MCPALLPKVDHNLQSNPTISLSSKKKHFCQFRSFTRNPSTKVLEFVLSVFKETLKFKIFFLLLPQQCVIQKGLRTNKATSNIEILISLFKSWDVVLALTDIPDQVVGLYNPVDSLW